MARTVIADIRNNQFPPLRIEEGTLVVWRNLDPYAHSAETLRNSPHYFSAGPLLPGETSSPIDFTSVGKFPYICRFHHGMEGEVEVVPHTGQGAPAAPHSHAHSGGGHAAHLKHFHGFVTGGRSAQRMYLSHTPVLADPRHNYQVILQASLPDKVHADAYETLRKSNYNDGKVQIFHDHIALPEIGSGTIRELPEANFEYYPNDPDGVLGGTPVPGLEQKIPVRIDKVLHFHQFQTEDDYPAALTYVVYGDTSDAFIDHFINRAPSFHSVAKVKPPGFFTGDPLQVWIPAKRIRDVSPKLLRRVAFVDNSFHLFWLPPTGVYPLPQDPLKTRDGRVAVYEAVVEGGGRGPLEIQRFLHFDVRLLNHGVLIV